MRIGDLFNHLFFKILIIIEMYLNFSCYLNINNHIIGDLDLNSHQFSILISTSSINFFNFIIKNELIINFQIKSKYSHLNGNRKYSKFRPF